MKKIVNILILIVVCLLPTVVDAKANLTFEKEFNKEMFLYEENGKSYFFNLNSNGESDSDSLHLYDSNNNLFQSKSLDNGFDSIKELYSYKPFFEYMKKFMYLEDDIRLYSDNNMLYAVYYENEEINYFDLIDEESNIVKFEDNANFTKDALKNKYDIFYHYKNLDCHVLDIDEFNNYYVVSYYDANYNYIISVIDEELNIILNFEYDYLEYKPVIYIYDNLIYVKKTNKSIDVYKLDGTNIQTLYISHELIDEYDNDDYCEYLDFSYMVIVDNKLYLPYMNTIFGCDKRYNFTDANEFVKVEIAVPDVLTLKYNLDFDVEKVESSNGEFTYEVKEDEDGKSYVELKITPKDGYSVKEIIVTDINGDRIEVTNNKFYKPLNDVKIEVKYVEGEYLPIPDTFLSKSLTLIIIGLVLVGLGIYTVNYVRNDKKVDI